MKYITPAIYFIQLSAEDILTTNDAVNYEDFESGGDIAREDKF